MKPRTVSLVLALGLFALALWMAFKPRPAPPAPPVTVPQGGEPVVVVPPPPVVPPSDSPAPAASVAITASTLSTPPTATLSSPYATSAPPTLADQNPASATTDDPVPRDARIDEGKVRLMLRDYHTLTGGNPVGTNAEIMRAVMGGNPKQATLGPPEGMSLNGSGELVDQWGTPYFFHQISGDVTEIRSAGPDKRLWTGDDVVTW